jgi:glycosyltransferase involved in cell wall biosynthesis
MSDAFAPLVTVITPTFNHEEFIGPCIESLIRQTYANWEQIIIDDGSTDKTAEIACGYSDSRIRYYHQENRGIDALAHNYNRALGMARGSFIAILEGDDLWPPDKLSRLIPNLTDDNLVLAYGAVADVSANGTWNGRLNRAVRLRRKLPVSILFNTPVRSSSLYMLRADGVDLIPPSTAVIRRSTLESIGGFQYFPNLCVTDFPTFISLSLKGNFYYTPEVVGYRRRHGQSATFQNQVVIASGVRRYQEKFVRQHGLELSRQDLEEIEETWSASKCDAEFCAGRLSLLRGQWQKGRDHFRRALKPSLPRIFLAALVGWCLSWTHCDMESLFAFVGIASMKKGASENLTSQS